MLNDRHHEPLVPPALRRIKRDSNDKKSCELRERYSHGGTSERENNDVSTSLLHAASTLPRERRSTIGGVVSQFNKLRPRRTTVDRMAASVGGFIRRFFGGKNRQLSLLDENLVQLDNESSPTLQAHCIKSQSNVSLDSITRLQFEGNTPHGYKTEANWKSRETTRNSLSTHKFLPGKMPIDIPNWNKRRHRLTFTSRKYEYLVDENQVDHVGANTGNLSLKNFANWQALRRQEKKHNYSRALADFEFNESDVDSAMSSDDWDEPCVDEPWVSRPLVPLGSNVDSWMMRRSVSSELISMEGLPSAYQSLTNLYCSDIESRSAGMSSRLCFSSLAALCWDESTEAANGLSGRDNWRVMGYMRGEENSDKQVEISDKRQLPVEKSCLGCNRKLPIASRENQRLGLSHMLHQPVLT